MNIQGVLSTGLTFLKDVNMSNFGKTPCIGMVTTGSAGMFRLRRRMRSDFAQHDSGNAANAVKGFLNLAGQVGVDHLENAGCEKCIFREFSQRLSYF
jgi:hypothetical protein